MAKISKISSEDIALSMQGVTRQYLVGSLKRPQSLEHYSSEALEVGVTRYNTFSTEVPHTHAVAHEFQYMISGATAYLNISDGSELIFTKGDFYIIEPGVAYAQKSNANTEILFIKVPSINDKNNLPITKEIDEWYKKPIK